MVTLTNREMLMLIGALRELAGMSLKTKFAFWVAKTTRDVEGVYRVYEERRLALLEKYAVRDEDGNYVYEDDSKTTIKVKDEFWKENIDLLEASGADVRQITLDFLDEGIDGALNASIMTALIPVVISEETEQASS
jgi:hypothetical protein